MGNVGSRPGQAESSRVSLALPEHPAKDMAQARPHSAHHSATDSLPDQEQLVIPNPPFSTSHE